MHLSIDSVAEAIKMEINVVEVESIDKLNRFHTMNDLHVPKLQTNLLSVSKFLLNM